jgi:DNA primase
MEGRAARDYISRRGLPAEVVESQRLGYAPARWDGLLDHLKKSGIEPSVGVKAGLLSHSTSDPSRFFDRFRNRLIFPIRDDRGVMVAFGGRILSQDEPNEPKYLNSPETPVYHKGRMLYQYHVARQACRQVRQALLVEGYMDLLAFHARGFLRVAATLGTALTIQQVRLLSRMCDEVVLAYDGDDAGEKAMLRALPLFLQEELSISCIRFPDAMDPDDFLKEFGLAELERLIQKRQELGAYAVRKAVSQWDGTSAGRALIFSELQSLFQHVRQPILKSEYLRIIADRFSIAEEVAEAQLLHEKRGRPDSWQKPFKSVSHPKRQPVESLEEKVLRLMIKHPGLVQCVRDSDALCCFEEPGLGAVAEVLCRKLPGGGQECGSLSVYDLFEEPEQQGLYTRYLLEPYEIEEPENQLKDWLAALEKRMPKARRKKLQQSLQEAERKGDQAQVESLLLEIRNLTAKTNICDSSDSV